MAPAIIFILLVNIYPLIYSLSLSFQDYDIKTVGQPNFVGLENFIKLSQDPSLLWSVRVAITFIIPTIILELLLGIGLALLLNAKLRYASIQRNIVTFPIVLTPVIVGILWRMILQPQIGYLNQALTILNLPRQNWLGDPSTAMFAIILVDVWQWTPFVALITLAALESLPTEVIEAARLDGASDFQLFRSITFPLISSAVWIAVLLRLVDVARIFDVIFTLTRGGPALATDVVSSYLYRISLKFFKISYASAISWVYLIAFTIFAYVFIKRTKITV